ncbi:MAG TPA: nucleotide disphospho-sugar-binding domain-containing protein, partial [Polyangiaceae bacterium]|nr:nucleotide disphospho-sugar-binding domain-containing protein [Polyangiaceae bacterium]
VSYAELASLLPRSALFVHHGGIGSTARAFEAGVPQIISPRGFDQPDNARRARELGVAHVIERHALSGPNLARAARMLWASQECAASCRRLEHVIRSGSRAEARCADVLEAQLSRPCRDNQASLGSVTERRTILFIVWPEPGHLAAPLALARQLRAQGDRVVFSGLSLIQRQVLDADFEFFELAPLSRSDGKAPSSVLWSWSGEQSPRAGKVRAVMVKAIDSRQRLFDGVQPLFTGAGTTVLLFDGGVREAHGFAGSLGRLRRGAGDAVGHGVRTVVIDSQARSHETYAS